MRQNCVHIILKFITLFLREGFFTDKTFIKFKLSIVFVSAYTQPASVIHSEFTDSHCTEMCFIVPVGFRWLPTGRILESMRTCNHCRLSSSPMVSKQLPKHREQ